MPFLLLLAALGAGGWTLLKRSSAAATPKGWVAVPTTSALVPGVIYRWSYVPSSPTSSDPEADESMDAIASAELFQALVSWGLKTVPIDWPSDDTASGRERAQAMFSPATPGAAFAFPPRSDLRVYALS